MLAGEGVAALFEKPSARTRISIEMAVATLGGHPIYIRGEEVGLDTRESVEDVARTMAGMCSLIAARVRPPHARAHGCRGRRPDRQPALRSAHPCQALADLLTLREHFGRSKAAGSRSSATATTSPRRSRSAPRCRASSWSSRRPRATSSIPRWSRAPAISAAPSSSPPIRTTRCAVSTRSTPTCGRRWGRKAEREQRLHAFIGLHGRRRHDEGREPRRGVPALPARTPRRGGRGRGDRRPRSLVWPQAANRMHAAGRCSSISCRTAS